LVAPIVHSVEISRSPDDVFAYVTDPSHSTEWQENLLSVSPEGEGPVGVGSRLRMTRRVWRSERTMTSELTEYDPPRSFAFRGIDGPIRARGKGTVEPVGDGTRSRFTLELDFEGHGIGKVLVPLVVRRQAQTDVEKSQANLKERLERGAV
jgi:uncharacterized protein YndB with AHSA1/START domain